ncbi:site-specific DNA-methyltransferase [Aeromonas hydrophila]
MNKQKLELTWIGKDKRPRLEPRIFLEDKGLSYLVPSTATSGESDVNRVFNDNLLIHGDNLLALKALEQQYAGAVKCIFIDPPYNTGSAFTHYDDGLEHSIWLSMMRARLELLRTLMSDDGVIWIVIDDNEGHYLKVMCDEIFGRNCFVSNVVWKTTDNSNNNAKTFSWDHNHILVYSKQPGWSPNFLQDDSKRKHFKNPDNDPRGPWFDGNPVNNPALRPNLQFDILGPNGDIIKHPPNGWRWSLETIEDKISTGEIRFSADGKRLIRRTYLRDMDGLPPSTLWSDLEDTGHNRQAKFELKKLFPKAKTVDLFGTPKPEKLIKKAIELSTSEGDLVLDSFGGSGTTGAVAHKMGRRWIMVELGEHCHTHIVPRLKKVIDGDDQGGISKSVNWQGGGGFCYLRLAPSLLKKDDWGNWVINKEYNAEMLAEAMCKHMGFIYAPSQTQFWNHGYSTETDHIYVTTGSLAYDQLKRISEEVGNERTLLICCKAFMMDGADFPNLTLKKIPKVILNKCEWDHDDYSFTLNVLPEEQDEEWADDDSEE